MPIFFLRPFPVELLQEQSHTYEAQHEMICRHQLSLKLDLKERHVEVMQRHLDIFEQLEVFMIASQAL